MITIYGTHHPVCSSLVPRPSPVPVFDHLQYAEYWSRRRPGNEASLQCVANNVLTPPSGSPVAMANLPNYDIALFFSDKFLNCFPHAFRGMVCTVSLVKIVSARYRHRNEATIYFTVTLCYQPCFQGSPSFWCLQYGNWEPGCSNTP